jgi:hypothetical protein
LARRSIVSRRDVCQRTPPSIEGKGQHLNCHDYIRDLLASVARPVIQLGGFQRVTLKPGEEKEMSFTIGPDLLRMLDRDMHWVVEPGTFRVLIGSSSKDIHLRGDLDAR